MKKHYSLSALLLLLSALIPVVSFAQSTNVSAYTAMASMRGYATTNTTLASVTDVGDDDDGSYNNKPIGFTFRFRGVNYTTISASTNGWLTFGRTISNAAYANNLSTGGLAGFPIVAPLWDDLDMSNGGFYYETTGTAPNRVFTAEWYRASWNYNASQPAMSFEVKLYENTNVVQFVYDRLNGGVNNGSASIGIAGAANDFVSVGGSVGNPTFSSTSETDDIDVKMQNNRVFTFTPARVLYDFAVRSTTYVPLTTTTLSPTGALDEGAYNDIAIGFPFNFRGVSYATISASTNGWLAFNQTLTDAGYVNDIGGYADGLAVPTLLAPLWDDLDLTGGGFRTSVSGTAPNRVFTAEWFNARWRYNAPSASLSFQVKLFEGSNRVWYVYNPTASALVSPSASIGFNDGGYFRSLNGTGAGATASTTVATDNLNTRPVAGQVFAFAEVGTLGGPLPVELTDFAAKRSTGTAVTLAWHTASEKNNAGFTVEKSANGQEFRALGFVAGAGSTTITHAYTYVDEAAVAAAYYRLRQEDVDGKFTYSSVQFVAGGTGKAEPLALYPNPAHGSVQVLNVAPQTPLALLDQLGRTVRTYPAGPVPLDLVGVAPGVYWLRAASQSIRLVVE